MTIPLSNLMLSCKCDCDIPDAYNEPKNLPCSVSSKLDFFDLKIGKNSPK